MILLTVTRADGKVATYEFGNGELLIALQYLNLRRMLDPIRDQGAGMPRATLRKVPA